MDSMLLGKCGIGEGVALQIAGGPESCLDSIGNVDFFKDVIQMILYRMRADAKLVRNIIIGGPHSDQCEYFNLPLG